MLPEGGADHDPELDQALFRNVGAAIARLHIALAGCPFGVESWEVGPGLLTALWRTMEDRLPAGALTELSARIRPRWDSIVQALSAAPQRRLPPYLAGERRPSGAGAGRRAGAGGSLRPGA